MLPFALSKTSPNLLLLFFIGNKKGVDHFVKYLSWIDDDGKLRCHLLDIDASLGDTKACARAVHKSLKKLGLLGRELVLDGVSTDSGGGGVLDPLADELRKLGVMVAVDECLVAACGIHCLQLQLSNPTTALIGEGDIGKRNAMQLCHTVYVLQNYLPWTVVVSMMGAAQEFHDQYCDKDYVPEDPTNKGDVAFAEKWNAVRKFREFQPFGDDTHWKACSACVLTRWQYVGAAHKYTFEYYLLLLKFCQIAINGYGSINKINKAASDLQSLLVEPYFYSDICLVVCFHDGYFQQHMNWMMQSNDLTGVCGFQSHQMAVRYYIMYRGLESALEDINKPLEETMGQGFFYHFIASLDIVGDNGNKLMDDKAHREKANKFVEMAMKSLQKHFIRWCSNKLLPAALMAETPLAMAVARVITGAEAAPMVVDADGYPQSFRSRVHGPISVHKFESFIREAVALEHGGVIDPTVYSDLAKQAASELIKGVDFRDVKAFKSNEVVGAPLLYCDCCFDPCQLT